jgi:hypothetical protein
MEYTKDKTQLLMTIIHVGRGEGDLGNVIATDGDSITLMRGIHEFKIPKSSVEGYNGSEVFLNIAEAEIYNFKA